jgi:hypothetical protein
MTTLTVNQIRDYWERNGGGPATVVDAVAVALAESGGRTDAISPSGDYGLWQINRIHFGTYGIDARNWSDPNVNAAAAAGISSSGYNWAAWCTCWTDPRDNCGHGFLAHPQPGSPAAAEIPFVSGSLNINQLLVPADTGLNGCKAAWGELQSLIGHTARSEWNAIAAANNKVRGGI